ncbi:S-layer homology domain-containing protein [Aquibacillus salsiterrae]|uniref:S-layer homology domain-containing protein n=1 Tax=Aquibacillus salsiterrae TaxID=2950439 RepID=A0A9X3WF82_9BACI|nr:S-layer homology domain-containing protein [Aquibacillus salsiterrae]MDC3415951.1 S-layer homology domain-containing protein [Aquibacillus salsiterrae]
MGKFKTLTLATITAVAMTLATAPAVFANEDSSNSSFSDVKEGESHYESITLLAEAGIIKGYPDDTFKPNNPLSRANAAVLFANALGLALPEKSVVEDYFGDVSATHTYASEIAAVAEAKIFKGANGNFQINSQLTREAMASTLVNAFQLVDTGEEIDVNVSNVSETHKASVKILAQAGITNQLDDFKPKEIVTRGQFATFLYKAIMYQFESGGFIEYEKPIAIADETTKEAVIINLFENYNEGDLTTVSVFGYDQNGEVIATPLVSEQINIVDGLVEGIVDVSTFENGTYLAEVAYGDNVYQVEFIIDFTEVDEIVASVNAATTEEELFQALSNDYFYDVEEALVADYMAAIASTEFNLIYDIQTVIDEININNL